MSQYDSLFCVLYSGHQIITFDSRLCEVVNVILVTFKFTVKVTLHAKEHLNNIIKEHIFCYTLYLLLYFRETG